jgi:hypothetical protein
MRREVLSRVFTVADRNFNISVQGAQNQGAETLFLYWKGETAACEA